MKYNKKELDALLANDDYEVGHFSGHQLVTPCEPTTITKEMTTSGFWKGCNRTYQKRSLADRACAAIINCAVSQMRLVFGISRSVLGRLLAKDENISSRNTTDLSSKEYNAILSEFQNHFAIRVKPSTSKADGYGEMAIFEITDPIVRDIVSKTSKRSPEEIVKEEIQQLNDFIAQGRQAFQIKEIVNEYRNWFKKYESKGILHKLELGESIPVNQLELIVKKLFKLFGGDEKGLELFLIQADSIKDDFINESADMKPLILDLWKKAYWEQSEDS